MTDQPTPKTATTEYVILRQHLAAAPSAQPSGPARPTEQWDRVGTVNARSAEHAIRQHAEKHTDKGADRNGVYIAIPKRSWNPCTVKAQVQTTLTITAA